MSSGAEISVRVLPRASRNAVVSFEADVAKIALTAPPVAGAANKALVEFLAKVVGVSRSRVAIVSGETARHKRVRVDGLSTEEVRAKLVQALSG